MRNAPKALIALLGVCALAACSKSDPQQNAGDNMAIGGNETAAPAQIEALPSDESSATPSNQLVNGDDNPDVNDLGTGNSE
ncbi:hypothetical protein ACUXST_000204 [Sphingomonas sp. F9_3S_D5_B_2]